MCCSIKFHARHKDIRRHNQRHTHRFPGSRVRSSGSEDGCLELCCGVQSFRGSRRPQTEHRPVWRPPRCYAHFSLPRFRLCSLPRSALFLEGGGQQASSLLRFSSACSGPQPASSSPGPGHSSFVLCLRRVRCLRSDAVLAQRCGACAAMQCLRSDAVLAQRCGACASSKRISRAEMRSQ